MSPVGTDSDVEAAAVVRLRSGSMDNPLFLFGGLEGDPNELRDLVSCTHNQRGMIGVAFCSPSADGRYPGTTAVMAARSCAAMRSLQPRGPYHILGYSFGGLIAAEVATLLRQSGEEVSFLGLIDTRYAHRYWPLRILLRSQIHLICNHLASLKRLPSHDALSALLHRSHRLIARFARQDAAGQTRGAENPAFSLAEYSLTLIKNHRPTYYPGRIILFNASINDDFGCTPTELWCEMATEVECQTISGTHLGIMRDKTSIIELAAFLDRYLERHKSRE